MGGFPCERLESHREKRKKLQRPVAGRIEKPLARAGAHRFLTRSELTIRQKTFNQLQHGSVFFYFQSPLAHCLYKSVVIAFALIGIIDGEVGDGFVKPVALTEVSADLGWLTGTGVSHRQRPSA